LQRNICLAGFAVFPRWKILSGQETGKKYARLSMIDREAVVGILRETKPGLPVYFKSLTR